MVAETESLAMNISDRLIAHSVNFPDKTAFIFLEDGEDKEQKISFLQLYEKVNSLAVHLLQKKLAGKRTVLLYPDSADFIFAFLACQLAGVIAVPVHFTKSKRQAAKLQAIIKDVRAGSILTTTAIEEQLKKKDFEAVIADTAVISTTNTAHTVAERMMPARAEDAIAFIQYTSGSTSLPKGVTITSANLTHNQIAIRNTFNCNEASVICSWLPFHHDMGLIGNILHAVYVGCTCIVMLPYHFMQKPFRWLKAVTKYKATHSGGPDFAYEYCVHKIPAEDLAALDLSGWQVAYCGSEPVRKETIDRFSAKFKTAGFRESNFYPCYGLAEATLLVSGVRHHRMPVTVHIDSGATGKIVRTRAADPKARSVVSCGNTATGMHVKIIAGRNKARVCEELEEGEICISGPSVTKGYWNKDNRDVFCEIDGDRYLKTGDMGFMYRGELFVHGRIKEMLILRGKNYYPDDIEQIVYNCNETIVRKGVVVFSKDKLSEELVIVAEIKREFLNKADTSGLIATIDATVSGMLGIAPSDIVLVPPFGIPRTTSGKLKRIQCGAIYAQHTFNAIASKLEVSGETLPDVYNDEDLIREVIRNGSYTAIRSYVLHVIGKKVGIRLHHENDNIELTDLGLDSLRSMEIVNTINKNLSLNLDAAKMAQNNTLHDLITTIENMIWLKNSKPSGKNIII